MSQEPRPKASDEVDALRDRLRTLGYLDAGVDRFVLAPARGARGAVAIALLASLRIGALGGMLLGPCAAAGVALQLPGLVTSVRDGMVVAVYLAVLFGGGIAIGALACGLLVAVLARRAGPSLARRGRALAIAAGAVVAIVSLVYLTLLWTAVRSGSTATHPALWIAAGLAVAAAISLLLGHAVTLTTLALIVAGTGLPMRTRGVPGASWRVMLGTGVAAFAAALAIVNVSGFAARLDEDPAEAPRLTVVPSGVRVRVFAIDGFDSILFDTLRSAGRMPALSRAFAAGGARLVLDEDPPAVTTRFDPARLWTTVATAQPAAVHGVRTLETRRVAGVGGTLQSGDGSTVGGLVRASTDLLRLTRPSIASGNDRHEKTFWEVAADAGLRTVVVNWWATWPATSVNGIVLSDRATLRLERGGPLDAELAPAALYQQLLPRWPPLRERAAALANEALRHAAVDGATAASLRRSAELDAMTLVLAREVTGPQTDLAVVYLPGLDVAQHGLLDGPAAGSPSAVSARVAALEAYYVTLDALLAPVLAPDRQELVMVVTAPGRVAAGASGRFALSGAAARDATTITARATDVAPTVLYALGVPISQRLAGAPLVDLFAASFTARYLVRHVTTYGRPERSGAPRSGQPLDQEMIDRLRSLGYVR